MSGVARTGGLDRFRVIAALLVVANHTSPLLDLSAPADHMLVQVLSRLAVPFFLMVTGFFLTPDRLRALLRHTLLLYGLATLLYLPLQLYKGGLTWAGLLRDLFFEGTFYHLWYFPGLLWALGLYALCRKRPGLFLPLAAALYLAGLLGDSYFRLFPALGPYYDGLFAVIGQARNLFLAPLFLALGQRAAERPAARSRRAYAAGTAAALVLLLGEGWMVYALGTARYSTMYLTLPAAAWCLFRLLLSLDREERPALRGVSTAVYLLHPWVIVGVRGLAKLTSLTGPLVENHLVHFLAVAALSFGLGVFLWMLKRAAGRSWTPPPSGTTSTP